MSNDITLHHHRSYFPSMGAVYNIVLQAETDAGRTWCVQVMGQMADPIIDRFGLDVATSALDKAGLKWAWTVGADLEAAIASAWSDQGDAEYADPIKVVECNDRLRITCHGPS